MEAAANVQEKLDGALRFALGKLLEEHKERLAEEAQRLADERAKNKLQDDEDGEGTEGDGDGDADSNNDGEDDMEEAVQTARSTCSFFAAQGKTPRQELDDEERLDAEAARTARENESAGAANSIVRLATYLREFNQAQP